MMQGWDSLRSELQCCQAVTLVKHLQPFTNDSRMGLIENIVAMNDHERPLA